MRTTNLRHQRDPVRQRRSAPRARARVHPGRRHRAPSPRARDRRCATSAAPTTTRSRTSLAAEAAGQPVAAFVDARAAALRRAPRAARALVRRLHPHQRRPAPPRRRRAAVARLRRGRRPLPARLRGPLLHRLRGVPRRRRAGRRRLRRARRAAGARRRAQLVLPPVALPASRSRPPIASGALRVEPETRRNEVLAVLRGGLDDISVSRASERARGWGIPVPGDPSQTVYVWFDALANYVTELGYASDDPAFERWWRQRGRAHPRRRQGDHALPRDLLARDPALGRAAAADPRARARLPDGGRRQDRQVERQRRRPGGESWRRYGADALRWWALSAVPRGGDADVRADVLARTAGRLADGLGNLVNRTIALTVARGRPPRPQHPADDAARALLEQAAALPGRIDDAFERLRPAGRRGGPRRPGRRREPLRRRHRPLDAAAPGPRGRRRGGGPARPGAGDGAARVRRPDGRARAVPAAGERAAGGRPRGGSTPSSAARCSASRPAARPSGAAGPGYPDGSSDAGAPPVPRRGAT